MKRLLLARLRAEVAQADWIWNMAYDALADDAPDFTAMWELCDGWRRNLIKADNAVYDLERVK